MVTISPRLALVKMIDRGNHSAPNAKIKKITISTLPSGEICHTQKPKAVQNNKVTIAVGR